MATLSKRYNPLLKSYPDSRKINSVSLGAETLYTRLVAQSDDLGNFWGQSGMVLVKLYSLRFIAGEVTKKDIEAWISELCAAGLVELYSANGETLLHMVDVHKALRTDRDPHIRFTRHDDPSVSPECPQDEDERGPQPIPNLSPTQPNPLCPEPSEDDSRTEASPVVLTFPTKGDPKEWHLRQDVVDELEELYESKDIVPQCKRALAWIKANMHKRKTAGGMRKFLTGWIERNINQGATRGQMELKPSAPSFKPVTPDELNQGVAK